MCNQSTQIYSSKSELRICAGSYPTCGVSEIRDGKELTMDPARNKAKRLSSVSHTTKTVHHHHQQQSDMTLVHDF